MTIGQLIQSKPKWKPYSNRTAPKAITSSMDFVINHRGADGKKISDRIRIVIVANKTEPVVFSLPPKEKKK